MNPISKTPEPPYYAVIFSNVLQDEHAGYEETAARMLELAERQPGFLGVETTRNAEGFGITVSYWASEEAIIGWRDHAEHRLARQAGRERWYRDFALRVAKVDRAYGK